MLKVWIQSIVVKVISGQGHCSAWANEEEVEKKMQDCSTKTTPETNRAVHGEKKGIMNTGKIFLWST